MNNREEIDQEIAELNIGDEQAFWDIKDPEEARNRKEEILLRKELEQKRIEKMNELTGADIHYNY
jgi:hypothetical protein